MDCHWGPARAAGLELTRLGLLGIVVLSTVTDGSGRRGCMGAELRTALMGLLSQEPLGQPPSRSVLRSGYITDGRAREH